MKRERLTARMEKAFWVYLFCNPLLDIFNGFYINVIRGIAVYDARHLTSLGVTPSLVVRMVVLLAFCVYLLLVRERGAARLVLPIGAAFLLSLLSEYLFTGAVAFFTDLQYIAKFVFNLLVIPVYARVFSAEWDRGGRPFAARLDTLLCATAIILSVSILLPALFRVGYSTYADRLGYRGWCGFFYAANDVTAVLVLLLPLTLGMAMRGGAARAPALPVAAAALTANTLLVIGSKTAFLAFAASFALLLFYAAAASLKRRSAALWRGLGVSALAAAAVFGLLMLLSGGALWETIRVSLGVTGELAEREGAEIALLSGRGAKLRDHLAAFRSGGALVWLFGMGRGSRETVLEMDVPEVLFYYGVFGLGAMLWFYVRMALEFLRDLFRRCDVTAFAAFTALALVFGYLLVAGHVLFTVTSGFYFSLTILCARAHFAAKRRDMLLWKKN